MGGEEVREVTMPKLVAWLLLFLCLDSPLAQVGAAQVLASVRNQLNTPDISLSGSFQGLLSSERKQVELHAKQFSQYALDMQHKIANWISQHIHLFGQCFPEEQAQNHDETRQALFTQYSPSTPIALQRVDVANLLMDYIPPLKFLNGHLRDRPDFAYHVLEAVRQTQTGKTLLRKYYEWIGDPHHDLENTQVLLQMGGNALTDSTFITSLIGPALDVGGSISNGEFLEPLSSIPQTLSGAGGIMNVLGTTADSGSEGTEKTSEGGESASALILGQLTNAEVSLGTSIIYGSSIPNTSSQASQAGGGLSTSVSGMSPAFLEVEASLRGSDLSSGPSSEVSVESFPSFGQSLGAAGSDGSRLSVFDSSLSGADGGSGSSLTSLASSPSAGGGGGGGGAPGEAGGATNDQAGGSSGSSGAGGGCCAGLTLIMLFLGIGCAGEYYIKHMHMYDGAQYEKYLQANISEQVEQLQEYLKSHPDRLRSVLERVKKVQEFGPDEELPKTEPFLSMPIDYAAITKDLTVEDAPDAEESQAELDDKEKPVTKVGAEETSEQPKAKSSTQKKSKTDKKDSQNQGKTKAVEQKPDGLGKMLLVFYLGYNAVPAVVSKQFGFYLVLLLIALVMSASAKAAR
eukprot:c207_g1_i1.p1 GENE.c207_g1_i1~~c207_g1_i1.p1  ORF type:complete len:629 (+),score=101.37 c207_g1_i1:1-1887(+)